MKQEAGCNRVSCLLRMASIRLRGCGCTFVAVTAYNHPALTLVANRKYDTAIREAMLVVETRLRTLSASTKWGVDLVNDNFGQKGVFATRFRDDGERQGFRDLFAGVMSVVRNDYVHNFRSPSLQETMTMLRLANMLLEKIESFMKAERSITS
jgi:uncharacterized protein (TIGR02391 family)